MRQRRPPAVPDEQDDDNVRRDAAPLLNASLQPSAPKLDKSGLYDLQQVKRVLDDQVVSVRYEPLLTLPPFWITVIDHLMCLLLKV